MEECIKCGASENKVRLFDVISNQGIEKMCLNCANSENKLILNKPTRAQLKESEKKDVNFRESLKRFEKSLTKPNLELEKQNITLKKIVEKNSEQTQKLEFKPRPDLVNNFHWILMRSRRAKKLSQNQLAKEFNEAETTIKMAEKGILPEENYKLVKKFENFFGIPLIKKEYLEKIQKKYPKQEISFDTLSSKNITVADLKEMKNSKEKNNFEFVIKDRPKEK